MNKVIHYCWFGGNPLTETAERSIASWHRFAPAFEIKRWDETNAPLDACSFVQGAYAAGYWAFVSDYVRFKVLYEYGGIYMDVGSELVKDITPLLPLVPFSAIQQEKKVVNPGLIAACEADNNIIAEVLGYYEALEFENSEEFIRSHTVNWMLARVLDAYGYVRDDQLQHIAGWTMLPCEYFDPVYGFGGFHVGANTYSVHRGSASWLGPVEKTKRDIELKLIPFIGHRPGQVVSRIIAEFKCNGFVDGAHNLADVTKDVLHRGKNVSQNE